MCRLDRMCPLNMIYIVVVYVASIEPIHKQYFLLIYTPHINLILCILTLASESNTVHYILDIMAESCDYFDCEC